MDATVRFYHGTLGARLVNTIATADGLYAAEQPAPHNVHAKSTRRLQRTFASLGRRAEYLLSTTIYRGLLCRTS
jgi:hypothetical protein